MRAKKDYGTRTLKHPFAACAFFISSTLAGYGAQFGDFTYVEYDTTIEITGFSGNANGEVAIPSEIVGKPVTSIGAGAFSHLTALTSVTIPDNVTSIGDLVFAGCSSLTSVTIPDGVTSIEKGTFFGCAALTSVTIPDNVTSIGEWAFQDCSSLTSVTIPDNVTSIDDGAFYGCAALTSISIPDGVTSIGQWAFRDCSSLTGVTIGTNITSIGYFAFQDCSSLTSVTIPDSVTLIEGQAFMSCTALTSVYFEGNAPILRPSVFEGADNATVYYLAGTTGWGTTFGGRPTEEAPLGGIPVDGLEGWFYSKWFGYYATPFDPWLFHAEHGFIFRLPASTNESTYFYDHAMGAWWWTNETNHPSLYAFNPPADNGGTDIESAWLWYFEGSNGPRSFVVLDGPSAGTYLFFGP